MTDTALAGLESGRSAVTRALGGATDDELSRRPAEGQWNAWETAYHLFDIERWYIAKLCEAASGSRAEALERFIGIWARLRDEAISMARDIPAERFDQPGLLSGVPDWTPRALLEAMAAHDREHTAQIQAARHSRDSA
jgi:hypothetical protein